MLKNVNDHWGRTNFLQGQKIVWVKKDYYHSDTSSYLRSVHQDDQPVIDSDDDVTLPDSALPGRAILNHVLHNQVEAVIFTEDKNNIICW